MFKDIFINLLKTNNISAYKLEKETGIPQSLLSNYKKGKILPTTENLIKLSEYFNVSIDYLLEKEEIKKPVGISNELWENLKNNEEKMNFAIWISSLSDKDLKRVKKLLNAADFLDQE